MWTATLLCAMRILLQWHSVLLGTEHQRKGALSPHKNTSIPHILMQTDKTLKTNREKEWVGKNPGWEYFFLDDGAASVFLKKISPDHAEAFKVILPGAIKADFLRLAWLYENGGVYSDLDMKPTELLPYTNLADIVLVVASHEQACLSEIYNAVMMAPPKSDLVRAMLALALERIKKRHRDRWGEYSCYGVAGPTLIAQVLKRSMPLTCEKAVCQSRFDSVACELKQGVVYTTMYGEKFILLKEGSSKLLQRDHYRGSPFSKPCAEGKFYVDVPGW